MTTLGIIALVYVLVAVLTYFFYFKNDTAHNTFEKIWLSVFWIFIPILWVIHKLVGRPS